MLSLRRVGALVAVSAGLLVTALPHSAQADKKPTFFNFTMSGAQVVPGPGDPDGTSNANVSLFFSKPYTVCAGTNPQNVQRPFTGLDLHRAPAGEVGPVVATMTGGTTDANGCARVEKKALMDIQDHPEQYYLDAHNAEFPDGAIPGTARLRNQRPGRGARSAPLPRAGAGTWLHEVPSQSECRRAGRRRRGGTGRQAAQALGRGGCQPPPRGPMPR